MKQNYNVGSCPICKEYGQMEVLISFEHNKLSIMCDNCLLEFDTVHDFLKNKNGYRLTYAKAEARPATLEEITNSDWYPYLE